MEARERVRLVGFRRVMAREEVEAGYTRGSIYVAPAFRAGLRAEAGEKVGVFVV